MRRALSLLVLASGTLLPATAVIAADEIKLPAGFHIETYVDDVPNARSMVFGDQGTLFIATRDAGNVYAVPATAAGSRKAIRIASGLNSPNGVAFRNGSLYVAEIDRIRRYDGIESNLQKVPAPVDVVKLPGERHHGWRYIAFGPDGKLYVPVGAPCNICDRDKDGFAQIWRMNPDGSGREVIAHGVRNTVGFTWHPTTKELWFTDNGRDMLGDDVPPCELNRLAKVGSNFGYPACHGGDIKDPEFGKSADCSKFVPPVQKLGPHVAPLGVKFYTGTQFPNAYRGRVFIAEHGSWNRTDKIGYRITTVTLDGNRAVSYEPFATGWLQADGRVIGRPVDLLLLQDGSMLVSDDVGGKVHRISYRP
jgi:glucose/arabinose dehydrogenase